MPDVATLEKRFRKDLKNFVHGLESQGHAVIGLLEEPAAQPASGVPISDAFQSVFRNTRRALWDGVLRGKRDHDVHEFETRGKAEAFMAKIANPVTEELRDLLDKARRDLISARASWPPRSWPSSSTRCANSSSEPRPRCLQRSTLRCRFRRPRSSKANSRSSCPIRPSAHGLPPRQAVRFAASPARCRGGTLISPVSGRRTYRSAAISLRSPQCPPRPDLPGWPQHLGDKVVSTGSTWKLRSRVPCWSAATSTCRA